MGRIRGENPTETAPPGQAHGAAAPQGSTHIHSSLLSWVGGSMGGEKQGRGHRVGTGGPSRTRLLRKSRRDLPPIALPCRNGAVSGSGIPRLHAVLPGGFLPPPELAPTSYPAHAARLFCCGRRPRLGGAHPAARGCRGALTLSGGGNCS